MRPFNKILPGQLSKIRFDPLARRRSTGLMGALLAENHNFYARGTPRKTKGVRTGTVTKKQAKKMESEDSLIQDDEPSGLDGLAEAADAHFIPEEKNDDDEKHECDDENSENAFDLTAVKTGPAPQRKHFLKDKYPELYLELFRAKNTGVDKLETLQMDSARIVNWICSDCHKPFTKSVVERVYLSKECPLCVAAKFKPLAQEYPEIAREWAPLKNPLYYHPRYLDVHSLHKLTWKCSKCDFEYEASVKQRCAGAECPRCVPKHGNWARRFPGIAKEWHPLRNGDLKFTDVNEADNRMIWWICQECAYEYEEGISQRLYKEKGCPLCRQDFRENAKA